MHIRYGFHGADLIGPHEEESHYDIPASAERYADQVKARLQAVYPDAEIEVPYDLNASGVMPYLLQTMIDDQADHEDVGIVEHFAGLVYEDYEWCVFADQEETEDTCTI